MPTYEFSDLTIDTTPEGQIEAIRGEKLPAGLVYSPIGPDNRSVMPAAAMRAMSSALAWAEEAQRRARELPVEEAE